MIFEYQNSALQRFLFQQRKEIWWSFELFQMQSIGSFSPFPSQSSMRTMKIAARKRNIKWIKPKLLSLINWLHLHQLNGSHNIQRSRQTINAGFVADCFEPLALSFIDQMCPKLSFVWLCPCNFQRKMNSVDDDWFNHEKLTAFDSWKNAIASNVIVTFNEPKTFTIWKMNHTHLHRHILFVEMFWNSENECLRFD